MLKRALFLVFAAVVLMALGAGSALAQFGAIQGDLKDETGKPMAGTRVVIERIDIKGTYNLKEKDTKKGHYYYGGLPIGRYNITWFNGEQKLDTVSNIRVGLGDPITVDFDMRTVKERQLAAQAGIQMKAPAGGGEAPGLTKEQREQIQAKLKQAEQQRQKQEKLSKSFGVGVEALKAARDQNALIAKAGITAQPGQAITPEMRAQIEAAKVQTLQEAVKAFQEAAESDPTQPAVFANLGDAWSETARAKRGDEQQAAFKSAFEAYEKAIVLKADDPTYHLNYGSTLATAGQMDKANEELNKAAQLDPKSAPMAFFNLGVILVNSGKMKEAVVPLQKSVEADPTYADSWYWLGMALSGDAKVDVATGKVTPAPGTMEALQKYLDLQPAGKYSADAKAAMQALGGTVQTEIKSEKAAKGRKKN